VPEERVFCARNGGPLQIAIDAIRLRRWIRHNQIDAIVDLELFAQLTAALSFLLGVGRRVGFHSDSGGGLFRGHLLTHRVPFSHHQHMARNYLQLVHSLLSETPFPLGQGRCSSDARPPDAAAVDKASRLLDRVGIEPGTALVLVNANASDRLPQRRWPMARFAEFIEQLLAIRPDVSILLIGGESDRATNSELRQAVGPNAAGRCFDIAGQLPIDVLPALFARCAVLVTNDSGPAHFAAVSDLPVVVLFGPETPVLFAPLGPATIISANLACSPCVSAYNQRKSNCRDNQCMQRISVKRVLEATLQTLCGRVDAQPRAVWQTPEPSAV
jgi:ADP-heptose:LPS heptosyltransferase